MIRTILVPTVLAALLALATASQVHAYGACSRSTTYTNPYTGRTATAHESTAVGPNGVYHEGSVSGSGPNGAYEAGVLTPTRPPCTAAIPPPEARNTPTAPPSSATRETAPGPPVQFFP